MSKCSYCGSRILFGGIRSFDLRFCNQKCAQAGALLNVSIQIPAEVVQSRLLSVHRGSCPKCSGPGPIDVHTSYSVWSAVLLTRWASHPLMSCVPCAKKAQLLNAVGSFFLGWWGFPWGIILTPVQVGRNVAGLIKTKATNPPSAQLERFVRLELISEARRMQYSNTTPPPIPR